MQKHALVFSNWIYLLEKRKYKFDRLALHFCVNAQKPQIFVKYDQSVVISWIN